MPSSVQKYAANFQNWTAVNLKDVTSICIHLPILMCTGTLVIYDGTKEMHFDCLVGESFQLRWALKGRPGLKCRGQDPLITIGAIIDGQLEAVVYMQCIQSLVGLTVCVVMICGPDGLTAAELLSDSGDILFRDYVE